MTTTTPPTTEADLAGRLRLAVTRLARKLRQQSPSGLTPSLLSALATIDRVGPMSLKELAAAEQVQPPSMTRIVAALENEGLVSRTIDAADRRVARVEPTASGRRLLHQVHGQKNAYLAKRLNQLSGPDRDTLVKAAEILERLSR